jgi:hypothetical protein
MRTPLGSPPQQFLLEEQIIGLAVDPGFSSHETGRGRKSHPSEENSNRRRPYRSVRIVDRRSSIGSYVDSYLLCTQVQSSRSQPNTTFCPSRQ